MLEFFIKNRIYFTWVIFCFIEIPNIAQQQDILPKVIPNSPTSAELGRFGAVPVGLFTGTAQISIPLYELKTNNFSLPVTLNYSSNGLKVDKVASWVGMDWSLEAGGVINRIIKGEPDDMRPLVEYPQIIESNPDSLLSFVQNKKMNDVENDEYIYNFLGNSGKFIFNAKGKVIAIPNVKLKITKSGNSITIVTQDGVQYIFSAIESADVYGQFYGDSYGYLTLPNSWYLTKIVHPLGDIMNFYYSNQYRVKYYSGVSQTISKYITVNSGNCSFNPTMIEDDHSPRAQETDLYSIHLDSIVAPNFGKVVFESTNDRYDLLDDFKLNNIKIYSYTGVLLRKIELQYSFISCLPSNLNELNYSLISSNTIDGNFYSTQDELKKRMFLNKLIITDKNITNVEKYEFDYYGLDSLPQRLSYAQDHWGFYNGLNTNNCFFPTNDPGINNYPGLSQMITSNNYWCSKEPNGWYSQKGMIKSIKYPTGGLNIFEYEPQKVGDIEYGGCRIAKVQSYANDIGKPEIKKYIYSEGATYSKFQYIRLYNIDNVCRATDTYDNLDVEEFVSVVSNSQLPLYSVGNYHITYPVVTISYGENFDNGGERHSFMVAADGPAMPASSYSGVIIPSPQTNYGWKNGTKISESYFKNSSTGSPVLIKSIQYYYKEDELRNKTITTCLAKKCDRAVPSGTVVNPSLSYTTYLRTYDLMTYKIISQWMPLKSKTTTTYDNNGMNPIEEEEVYQYDNPDHQLLTRKYVLRSNGNSIINKYKYAGDYSFLINPSCRENYTSCKTTTYNKYNLAINQCYTDSVNCINNCDLISDPAARNTCLYSCGRKNCRDNALTAFIIDSTMCYNSLMECLGLNSDTKPIFSLQCAYQLSTPVEEQTLEVLQDAVKLISGKLTKYKIVNENIVPDSVFLINTETPLNDTLISTLDNNKLIYHNLYKAAVKFDKFDSSGNILEYHKIDNIRTSFYWGYSNTLPVIKAENITYDELKNAVLLSGSNLQELLEDIGELTSDNQKNLWKNFNTKLISNLPAGSFITTYTYKPLIGITSQTDPNGQATYYEYDDSGRLKCIKDNDGNILKSNEYHYQE